MKSSPLPVVAAVLIGAATFAVFSPAARNDFVNWDDDIYVYENPKIMSWSHAGSFFTEPHYRMWIPLTLLSHTLDYTVWGDDPRGHHLSNIVFHSVNASLVFLLILRLIRRGEEPGPDVIAAALAALLFALHPLRVETAVWISDRKDLLCALFSLLALLMYTTSLDRKSERGGWSAATFIAFLLALMSKSTAVVLPLLFIVIEHVRGATTGLRAQVWRKAPYFVLSFIVGVVALLAAPGSDRSMMLGDLSISEEILLALFSPAFYLVKSIVPIGIAPIYPVPRLTSMLPLAMVTVVLTGVCVRLAKTWRTTPLLAWLAYLTLLVPAMVSMFAGIQPLADRYAYLPSVALFALLAGGIASALRSAAPQVRAAIPASSLMLVGLLSMATVQQIRVWQNSGTLWQHTVALYPELPIPYNNIGTYLVREGEPAAALEYLRKALTVRPVYPDAYYNLGVAFEALTMNDSALVAYGRAILLNPAYVDAFINLGNVQARTGALDEAIRTYGDALRLDSANADAHYNMGVVLEVMGRGDEAVRAFEAAIRSNPRHVNAYLSLGMAYRRSGDRQRGDVFLRAAARLGSSDAARLLED